MRVRSSASPRVQRGLAVSLYLGEVRRQEERDEVTLMIASWLLIGGVLGVLILVLGHLLF